ncbi:MAG TPA: DUF5777 family beta-barrel protein [Chitinophagaceae bacterium]|nr:DUF5777 family beta-barrel protein [Chitinophagaceae bacterium]
MKKVFKRILILFLIFSETKNLFAQGVDLLKLVEEDKPKKTYVDYAFKSPRVINSHSIEMVKPGVLDFRVLHRFGNINKGLYEFFGLDQATIRLGLDYGISRNLTLGVGRSSYKKEIDSYLKFRVIHQAKGPYSIPFSVLVVAGSTINMLRANDPNRKNYYTSRLAYYYQLLIGSKITEGFSLQFSPTVVHRNLVPTANDPHDLYAAGVGARIKLSKRTSFNVDYYYVVNQNPTLNLQNPLSIGFDIETGGHVFQFHVTNALGMNERAFLTETANKWSKGDIQIGFNISRAFQIKKKRKS